MSRTTTGTPDPLTRSEAAAVLAASDATCKGQPFPDALRGEYDAAIEKTNGKLDCLSWATTYVPALLGRPLTDADTATGLVDELMNGFDS